MTGWLSIVLAFIFAMGLGLPLVGWLQPGPFLGAGIGIGLYFVGLLYFWFVLDGLDRR